MLFPPPSSTAPPTRWCIPMTTAGLWERYGDVKQAGGPHGRTQKASDLHPKAFPRRRRFPFLSPAARQTWKKLLVKRFRRGIHGILGRGAAVERKTFLWIRWGVSSPLKVHVEHEYIVYWETACEYFRKNQEGDGVPSFRRTDDIIMTHHPWVGKGQFSVHHLCLHIYNMISHTHVRSTLSFVMIGVDPTKEMTVSLENTMNPGTWSRHVTRWTIDVMWPDEQ